MKNKSFLFIIASILTACLGTNIAIYSANIDSVLSLVCVIIIAICCVGAWCCAIVQYIIDKKRK